MRLTEIVRPSSISRRILRPTSTGCRPERNVLAKNPSRSPSSRRSMFRATPIPTALCPPSCPHIAAETERGIPASLLAFELLRAPHGRVVERQTRWLQVPVRDKRVGVQIPPRPPPPERFATGGGIELPKVLVASRAFSGQKPALCAGDCQKNESTRPGRDGIRKALQGVSQPRAPSCLLCRARISARPQGDDEHRNSDPEEDRVRGTPTAPILDRLSDGG